MIYGSIRVQFSLYVSLGALVILLVVVLLSVSSVKSQFVESRHQNATIFLENHINQLGLGITTSSETNGLPPFQLFYLDEHANELPFSTISDLWNEHIDTLLQEKFKKDSNFHINQLDQNFEKEVEGTLFMETVDLEFLEEFVFDIKPMENNPKLISIGQLVPMGDRTFTIGVSYPREQLENYGHDIISIFKVLVPMLVFISGVATWFIVGHVLRPVLYLTRDADRINEQRVNQRLEEPKSDNEFRFLAKTLNAMLTRIEQAQQSQKQFFSNVSHELKSPITATKLLLEVSQQSSEHVDWEKTLAALTRENERFARLVNDVLILAKIDESRGEQNFEELDLEEILIEESIRPRKNTVKLTVNTATRISGNESHILAILGNILDNADRYAVSAVEMSLNRHNGDALVKIEDDGPGIPYIQREAVFERFFRISESRARHNDHLSHSGAGLGLSIARELTLRNCGTLVISKSRLGGACFTLKLPISE